MYLKNMRGIVDLPHRQFKLAGRKGWKLQCRPHGCYGLGKKKRHIRKIAANALDQLADSVDVRTDVPEIMIRYGQDRRLTFARLFERLPYVPLFEQAVARSHIQAASDPSAAVA